MKLSTHLLAITLTTACHTSMALVHFNIEATISVAENNGTGTAAFAINDVVNLTIVLKDDADAPNTVNDNTTAAWTSSGVSTSLLFDSISMNGATGTLSYANGGDAGEQLSYSAGDPSQIGIISGNDLGIGLLRNGQEFQAIYVYDYPASENVGPLTGDSSVTTSSLFLPGTYGANPGSFIQFLTTDGSSYGGAINSFTVTNVPEPTSYAAVFGLFTVAMLWARRRK